MTRRAAWSVEGRDWPNRAASRFVPTGQVRWHVQVSGAGPPLLLLHGTGAATHSWRTLAPLLAETHTVIAPDLPGHGFTDPPVRASGYALPGVARAVASLLVELKMTPRAIVGHSAGAAVAVRMALDGLARNADIVGINAALLPFAGVMGPSAPLMARAFFYNPFASLMVTQSAFRPGAVEALIRGTGSRIDAEGLEFYRRLFSTRAHVKAAIGLMAHWDLEGLRRDMSALTARLALIVGERDRAVPPSDAAKVTRIVAHARVFTASGVGHLAHEEDAHAIAALIAQALSRETLRDAGGRG